MNLQRIPLTHLIASAQPRPLLTAEVDKLSASIRDVGLIQPIVVIPTTLIRGIAEPGWKIVAGHHRVAACRALGWTQIEANVIDQDMAHLQTELIEIDENLCRAELTVSQRTKCTKRRKEIWDALNPAGSKAQRVADLPESAINLEVGTACPPQVTGQHGGARPQTLGFAASTAAATGMKKRCINQHLARADALGDDALDKITRTSLDSVTEMDALAKLPVPERTALIERAVAGEKVSARCGLSIPPMHATRQTPESADSKISKVVATIKKSLRNVLDEFGFLSVDEFAAMVACESRCASEDEIALLEESVDYLEKWKGALQS